MITAAYPIELVLVIVLNFAGTQVEAIHQYKTYPNMGLCESKRKEALTDKDMQNFAKEKVEHWKNMGYSINYGANYGACRPIK